MFVIFLALMYTVPAAHLILVDDHTEEFQFDENLSVNGTFFQSFEPELFMTEEFVDDGNNSSILVRQYDNTATLQWSDVQPFGPSGALESVEVVRNGNHLTFTNYAHIWTIDQTTGERVGNTFNCFVYDDDNVPQNTPYFDGGCDAAIQFEDTIYVVNQVQISTNEYFWYRFRFMESKHIGRSRQISQPKIHSPTWNYSVSRMYSWQVTTQRSCLNLEPILLESLVNQISVWIYCGVTIQLKEDHYCSRHRIITL